MSCISDWVNNDGDALSSSSTALLLICNTVTLCRRRCCWCWIGDDGAGAVAVVKVEAENGVGAGVHPKREGANENDGTANNANIMTTELLIRRKMLVLDWAMVCVGLGPTTIR